MKKYSFILIIVLAGLLLSSCVGLQNASSWPGVSAREDMVYVAYGAGVLAVNAATGSEVWRIPEKADPAKQYYAAPSFLNGQILVGDYKNTLHSLDAATGAENWAFSEAKGRFIAGAVVVGDLILAPSVDNTLYALNTDGRLQWKFTASNDIWASPVSDGSRVYAASMDRSIYALNLKDGSLAWSVQLGTAILSTPALVEGGMLYVSTLGNEVAAVDASGGAVVWTFTTADHVWASPVVNDGTVFVGDVGKNFYALDAKTGAEVWRKELTGAVYAAAALTPESLIIATDSGDLLAYSFAGEKLWSQRINGKLYSTPVLLDGKVFVGVKDGEKVLYAYDVTGKELWSVAVPK